MRAFGVSNFNPGQIELLKTAVTQPLIANQLQLSAAFTGMIDRGFCVNMKNDAAVSRDGGILEYSRIKGMTIQAWSPFQSGTPAGVFVGSDAYPELNKALVSLGEKYGITPSAAAIAFLLRHPAKIQVILGTIRPQRIREISRASEVYLTRDEWYDLYAAAGNRVP